MHNSKSQFLSLLVFLTGAVLVLSNGFAGRVLAQDDQVDVYRSIAPIGEALNEIVENYVDDPNVDEIVEGALVGMMNALDRHSSYISADMFREMRQETEGQFDGIGVSIRMDDDQNITVFQPIPGSPAATAGIHAGDMIVEIDEVSTQGMGLGDAAQRIRGPEGTTVHLTVLRPVDAEGSDHEILEFEIERGKIPIESIVEARVLEGGVGYVRLSDFKGNTASDLADRIEDLKEEGMTSLVLDLRWNPGGLLSASKEVAELFLPTDTLVTYTKGRTPGSGVLGDDLRLYTSRQPVVPENFPIIVLTNESTASSSEIVTGALQYWSRAIVVGEKTYGKGSVQTVIPLRRPAESALRLTTAHYYTPGDVTIDEEGIRPDVEVPLPLEDQRRLLQQMYESYESDAALRHEQNHGSVTGNEVTDDTVEDVQLKRAVEILREDDVFERLVARYHRDVSETQVAATRGEEEGAEEGDGDSR